MSKAQLNDNEVTLGYEHPFLHQRALPEYRLARRRVKGSPDTWTIVLQRAYEWRNGNDGGVEWEDQLTVDLEP